MILENKRFDLFIPLIVGILMGYGLLILRSAVLGNPGIPSLVVKQFIWNIIAFSAMMITPLFGERFLRNSAYLIYALALFLLIIVLILPHSGYARRWLDLGFLAFQPSELSKLSLVLLVPRLLISLQAGLIYSLVLTSLHAVLIIMEPDLGTAVLLLFAWISITLASNVRLRYILVVILVFALMVPIFYYFGLEDYQRQRLMAFFNPQEHAQGAAYNVLQSIHAIGSGKLFGRGYMSGIANLFGFVPVDHTDFIIAVVGEELGFVGVIALVMLYFLLMLRIYFVYGKIEDDYWKLVIVGVGSILFFHVVENLLMCVGWAPVTGIPLPFVSYGGSSTLIFGIMMGLVMKSYAIADTEKILRR